MFTKITENVEIHQTLPDTPNLTTQELKKEWDKGCKIIKEAFNDLIDTLNNDLYPIGYRMIIDNDKDYSNHLGFTWQKVAKGRVLIGKDENDADFNTIGKIGGEKNHVLTIEEMPSHHHSIDRSFYTFKELGSGVFGDLYKGEKNQEAGQNTNSVGANKAHNNLPPFEVVNIWERIL